MFVDDRLSRSKMQTVLSRQNHKEADKQQVRVERNEVSEGQVSAELEEEQENQSKRVSLYNCIVYQGGR